MRARYPLIAALFALGSSAMAADVLIPDTGDRQSPLDSNPACMERDVASTSPACVVPADGAARHYVAQQPAAAPSSDNSGGGTITADTSGKATPANNSGKATTGGKASTGGK